MTTVKEIYDHIDSLAPFAEAAPWDNSGLLIGSEKTEVTCAIVALDVTQKEIEQAIKANAQLIISHHPVIFRAQKAFLEKNAAYEAARAGLTVLCAHTNLDKAPGGVNDTLCDRLGMEYKKLPPDIGEGFLNVGTLPVKGKAPEIAGYIAKKLNAAVRFGSADAEPSFFAVCSGAGADLAAEAKAYGCDALITGDASYHDFLDAQALGVTVFAAGHFETEIPVVPVLTEKLSKKFKDIVFIPSEREKPISTEK